MTEFLLLRHAPTQWNRDGRIQGRSDRPLSPEGRATASSWRLPAFARSWATVASPLIRAVDTGHAMGLRPESGPPFVEMDWGGFEGRTLTELRAEGGAGFAAEERRGLDFRPPGGESPREVGARALAGLRAMSADTVVVTHKGVLRPLFALALGWDMRSKSPVRMEEACGHRFAFRPDGSLQLIEANIALVPSGV